MTAKTPEERIAELGLILPPPARAVANYVPWVITGNLVMTQAICHGQTASSPMSARSAASFPGRTATSPVSSPA